MRFRVLDSWRGILALLVALSHFEALWPFVNAPPVRGSYLAVDFFFVLSGFVIAHAYGTRVREAASGASFMLRRFGRLWPLHAALLLILLAIQLSYLALAASGIKPPGTPFWGGFSATFLPANFLMFQATSFAPGGTWNFPSWSISVEFWTYLVFAFAALTFRDRLGRAALPIALAGGVAVLALSDHYMSVYDGIALFRCIYGFFVGVAIHALIVARGLPDDRFAARAEWPVVVLALVFIAFAEKSVWTMLAPFVFGALIYVFSAEAGTLSRALKAAPFLKLGAWSYSIYMVHAVILFGMKDAVRVIERMTGWTLSLPAQFGEGERRLLFIHDEWTTALLVVVFLATTIALAALTYRFVEKPGQKLFNRLAKRMDERAGIPKRRPLRPRIATGSA